MAVPGAHRYHISAIMLGARVGSAQADSGGSHAGFGWERNGNQFKIATIARIQFRSHLLKVRARGGAGTLHTGTEPPVIGRGTPLVRASALHGVSGYSEPKATWAQPLSREELS